MGDIVQYNAQELAVIELGERLGLPGRITPTKLDLPADYSLDDWLQLGEMLKGMHQSVQWWVGDWWAFGERKWGDKAWQALDGFKRPDQTVYNIASVARRFQAPENLLSTVDLPTRHENLSFTHHQEVAYLPPQQAEALLNKAEQEGLTVRELRTEVREIKQAITRDERNATIALNSMGRYAVVYADPPWRYDFAETDSREIENQYPTMSLEEICDLPVPEIAYEDAILFMWATAPKLEEAFTVLRAWGFSYKTNLVWVKDKIGMGYHARGQHEHILIAKRGNIPVPLPEVRPASVLHAPRTIHSRKPPEFYEVIERMYPDLPRIELFSRTRREGWAAWGNEVIAA
jgi:N6-adenosine-specific RNA methylase IME4